MTRHWQQGGRRRFLGWPAEARRVLGEGLDGGGLEKGAERDVDVEGVAEPGNHLGGQERVTAQLEKVVVDPDSFPLEDLFPGLRDQGLGFCTGRSVRLAGGDDLCVGIGQRVAIDLAVGGERQGVEEDEGRGNHRLGERVLEPAAEFGGGRRRVVVGNEIGDQLSIPCASGRATATAA